MNAMSALHFTGVELFDAGTTAEYYATHFGFRRCESRRAFAALWRQKRSLPIERPSALLCACDDLRALFEEYVDETEGCCSASRRPRAGAAPGQQARGAPRKHTVRLTGLPLPGTSEHALRTALEEVLGPGRQYTIERVKMVECIGAAFVTFAEPTGAAAALALNGCTLPLGAGAHAPNVQVVLHGRKVKGGSKASNTMRGADPAASCSSVCTDSGKGGCAEGLALAEGHPPSRSTRPELSLAAHGQSAVGVRIDWL